MATSQHAFTLQLNGQGVVVTAFAENGTTRTLYTDAAMTSSVTLPVTLTSDTTYYTDTQGRTEASFLLTYTLGDGVSRTQGVNVSASTSATPVAIHIQRPLLVVNSGTATLVGGTKAVADTSVTANTIVRLAYKTVGGTPGAVYVAARSAGTSFTITSTSGTDTSVIYYEVLAY